MSPSSTYPLSRTRLPSPRTMQAQRQFRTPLQHNQRAESGGVMWCGVEWGGVVVCGGVWCGVVWYSVVWCGVEGCEGEWRGMHRSRSRRQTPPPPSPPARAVSRVIVGHRHTT
eukprot:1183028-Rhodomonas_salina.1